MSRSDLQVDNPPYHGWMIGFHKEDLTLAGAFCTTPDSTADDSAGLDTQTLGGAIWQAGFGPAADNDGFIYCITGNGLNTVFAGVQEKGPLDGYQTSFNNQQHVNYIGTDGHVHELVYTDHWSHTDLDVAAHRNRNYADSMLQLDKTSALKGLFTPPDPLGLTLRDTDFGSAGPLVLPDGGGGGKFVVGCGKDANVYLVDRTLMAPLINQIGKFTSTIRLVSNPSAHPITGDGGGPGVWGGPAYYESPRSGSLIYYCGDHGPLQAIAVVDRSLKPIDQTPPSETFPNEGGIIPVVTSNGSTPDTGVVWGITRPDSENDNKLHLRAYDADNLKGGHLFDGEIGPWNPSGPGTGAFLVPMIVNGKVYIAADHLLIAYHVPAG